MTVVRSFIVRIYGRRGAQGLSGTVERVQSPGPAPREAFANDTELLALMRAGRKVPGVAPAAQPEADPGDDA